MANALPILLLAGGAALMLGRKKRRRTSTKEPAVPAGSASVAELPDVDEDLDADEEAAVGTGQTPVPRPTPVPDPTPEDILEPSEPYGKPGLGPSGSGSCANSIYTRDPGYIVPDLSISQAAMAALPEKDMYFYIRPDAQSSIYNYMLEKFTRMREEQERKSVASVVLREALKDVNQACKWESPIDTLGGPERLVWESGKRLAVLAQLTAGLFDPSSEDLFATGQRFTVSRESLGEPDPGFMGAQEKPEPGRRVEILATDESMENAEHIIAQIQKLSGPNGEPNLFEVRVVDKFQGQDVTPRLRAKHGFKTGSNAYFSQKGPTGIYRIFGPGVT